jgi:dipeptidyl aminopeptidase/acylaminoacyl peptidase
MLEKFRQTSSYATEVVIGGQRAHRCDASRISNPETQCFARTATSSSSRSFAVGSRADSQAPAGRALAIEDYYRFKTVSAPELSPDGRWVAFTVGTRIEETNGLLSEVWVVPFDASAPARRVSPERANTVAPSWTSDGRLRFTTGGRTLTVEPSNPERVDSSTVRAGRGAPQTSPDGKWVASVRDTPPPVRSRVYASDFEKRHDERFKGVQYDWMEFHRDGGPFPLPNATDPQVNPPQEVFIAATGDDEKSARQLTHLAVRPVGLQWSPDGTTLLFSVDSAYRNEHVYGRTDIFTATLDGKVRRLTPSTEFDYNGARYSPDGKWILASRQLSTDAIIAKKMTHGAAVELVVLPANGGAERVLTADWDYIRRMRSGVRTGRFVYFVGGVGGTEHLFRVPVIGGAVLQVTSGQRRLAGFSFDKTFTKMSYSVGTFDAPSELWGANVDGSGEHQLTHVNDDLVAELALSRAERLQFKSADGTPVEGWLTFPSGYRAGSKYRSS